VIPPSAKSARHLESSARNAERGSQPLGANLHRKTTIGETGEGSLPERKYPDGKLQRRGAAIFAQKREESIVLPFHGDGSGTSKRDELLRRSALKQLERNFNEK